MLHELSAHRRKSVFMSFVKELVVAYSPIEFGVRSR